jgi:hypothetical protein
MIPFRALYHMVRADFLERVRRYSFLLTLAISVYLAYAVHSGQVVLQLDKYRGVDNSAWLGSVVGLVASVWLTLVGFYIVKNAIQRDRQTRVGQILATTPISKSFYTLSKTLSNFAVLAAMVLVLALGAIVIQLFHRADPHIDLFALLSPVLLFGLSSVAITAALALLFESLPILRGGVGNILYFFLWTFLLIVGANGMVKGAAIHDTHPFVDYTGLVSVISQMQNQVRNLDPEYDNSASFDVGDMNPATKTFLWTGVEWSPALILSRAMLALIAVALALLAAFFFDRFDPARAGWFATSKPRPARKAKALIATHANILDSPLDDTAPGLPPMHLSAVQLAPLAQTGSRMRFLTLVRAELRLMLRGHAWWWYITAAGLFIACLASPIDAARSGIIVFAWIWPALFWSQMGTRENQFSTGSLIFSAPHAVPRQLIATYAAGVLLAAITGGGLALRLLLIGDFPGLAAWAAGALFIPALALALGVATGSRKFFEALYTAWWYVGPLHHLRPLDFMGTTSASSTPAAYLSAALLLVLIAYVWRRIRLANV